MADTADGGFDLASAKPVAAPADDGGFDLASAKPVSTAAAAPEETSGRVAGLGERALVKGLGQLVDTPSALLSLADRAGKSTHDYVRHIFGLPEDKTEPPVTPAHNYATRAAETSSDVMGMPKPETPGERIGSAAVSALPSAALTPSTPIMGALSAGAGAGTSQTVAEAGGSPIQQTLAGLAAGSATAIGSAAAAGTRAAIRGGASGQTAMQARMADAAASDTPLTVGQASGNKALQAVEGASPKMWGGAPIRQVAEEQTRNIGSHVDSIVDNLSQGADVSPTAAGTVINKGVTATKGSMRAAEKAAYNNVDAHVPPQSPIDVSNTVAKLDALSQPTPGAVNTTAALVPPKIAALRDNLKADIAANGGNPKLPYEAATALKTGVGNSVDWGFAPSDPVTNGALKQVHGALKDDIDAGAAAISPQAAQAVKNAKSMYAANQARRDALNPIIDRAGGPEAVYQAATNGTKQGATKIGQVMGAIAPDQQNIVRATVLDRMGRALPSQQNASGDAFNVNTFLTNWNKLDPAAKDALFGASGTPKSLRDSLDSLTRTASTIRGSTVFKNPSGTGEAVGHSVGLMALLEGGGAALAGHPAHLGATAGAIAANHVLARALTNPRVAQWLAQSTKLSPASLPNAVNQLAKMGHDNNDPDARDLAAYLQDKVGPAPIARASGGKVDHEALVNRLIARWKAAKKETDRGTAGLLNVPDETITKALKIAQQSI